MASFTFRYPIVHTAWTGQTGDAPHGLAVDDAGNLWAALQGGGRVVKFQVVPSGTDEVTLTEKSSIADAQRPTELAFDGVFLLVTHSYKPDSQSQPVLSDLVGIVSVATGESRQVAVACTNTSPSSSSLVPTPVKYGPGAIALSRDHVWLSCTPHVSSNGLEFDMVLPVRLNPVSGKCSPGWPFQEFADRVYAYAGWPVYLQMEPGPIAFDAVGGVHVAAVMDIGESESSLLCLRAVTSDEVLETDRLAVRSLSEYGSILAATPGRTANLGTGGGGKGVVYPLVGVEDNDTVLWDAANKKWKVGPGGGGGGGDTDAVVVLVPMDGGVVGDVVYLATDQSIAPARADMLATTRVMGVKVDTCAVMVLGVATVNMETGLSAAAGDDLYLSTAQSGRVTNVPPTYGFLVYVGQAKTPGSSPEVYIDPARPIALTLPA